MRFPIRASVYLLNVKFINCLRCFPIGGLGERDARKWIDAREENVRFRGIFARLGGSFVKFEYSCFLRVYSTSFSLARIDGKKNFSFLESDSSCFSSALKQLGTQLSIPALPFVPNFAKFPSSENSLNFFTDQPLFFFFFATFPTSSYKNLVTKIVSTIFLRVFQKFRNLKIFQRKIEKSYASLKRRKYFCPNFLLLIANVKEDKNQTYPRIKKKPIPISIRHFSSSN